MRFHYLGIVTRHRCRIFVRALLPAISRRLCGQERPHEDAVTCDELRANSILAGGGSRISVLPGACSVVLPAGIGIADQAGIKIALVAGYLLSDPGRFFKGLIFPFKLNLCNIQPFVFSQKFIYFPGEAI